MKTPSDAGAALVRDPYGAQEPPIYQTSTFTFERAADAAALFAGEKAGFVYTRIGNPTVAAWEQRVVRLETSGTDLAAAALAFASGMGAISATALALLQAGDHLVAMKPLYGGTSALFGEVLPRLGMRVTRVAPNDWDAMRRAVALPRTRAVFIETPANPTLDVVDIWRVAALAHEVGAALVVDNTFATPVFQRPLALGADVVVHSSTKYLGGHGTVVGGVSVAKDVDWVSDRLLQMRKLLGAAPSPSTRGCSTRAPRRSSCGCARRRRRRAGWRRGWPRTRPSRGCATRVSPPTSGTVWPASRCPVSER